MSRSYCFAALLGVSLLIPGFRAAAQPPADRPAPAARTTTGPVTRPMIVEIAKDTYFINEFGMDAQYVIVGEKRALVIDTGAGFYDMKAMIEVLTKLPYDVAITHGHPDHAGGRGQFDTVYMHPADIPSLKNISYEQEVQYGEIMWNMAIGYHGVWGYTSANARKFTKEPEIKPLSEGQVFDLGGRKVTVYCTPGHSLGEVVFIDDKSRILFSGDAANGNVGAVMTSVSTILRGLVKLQRLRPGYDRQYTGHISYAGTIDAVSQKPQVLDDVVEAFRSLLRGNAKTQVIQNHLFPERSQTVAVYGVARVGFNPERLWEPGEEHLVP